GGGVVTAGGPGQASPNPQREGAVHVTRPRLERVGFLGRRRAGFAAAASKAVDHDSAQQRGAIGKPPVERRVADAGAPRDLVQGGIRPALNEDVARGDQDVLAIAARVRSQWLL